ncbi:uncharacterized protein Z518_09312 [Rhinocladiella mackenziei CBS 650.93]|uniref:Uncharacterized protein n=1 Tax=Rhinocladiella mackenziei CBS 650.93 TaxID=1442369 RepID=A0A0D2IEC0_9EURO|nr:uncharacterized protein Z518_09312 [Rhinocladiella mackenziei CBS 650.93]KIX01586.1 hypothetical protein Z518_09312 [Rhinocladiella mackenziei CBS 650.93]
MERRVKIWAVGSLAGVCGMTSSVLNVAFASNVTNVAVLAAPRILLFIALTLVLVNLASIAYFSTLYVKNLNNHSPGSKPQTWGLLTGGVISAAASLIVSGVTLVWLVIRRGSLPKDIWHTAPPTLLGIWFALWAVSVVLQMVLYGFLGSWTRSILKTQRVSRLDLDFGIRVPSTSTARRPSTQHTNPSFGSQELTLRSPPRTPVSKRGSMTGRSSSTRVGTGSSKTKLVRHSNHSSFECMPFPAGEATAIDSVFDQWDTSSVHHEMRAAIHPSPPVTRSGLETIPGSRPESPANPLNGPLFPDSPDSRSPHAATSDTATAAGWSSSLRQPVSSPPSTPPNFSRPTSSSYNKPAPAKSEKLDASMQEFIPPVFRPHGHRPPPVAIAGTMATASPFADPSITPRTLSRLRSNTVPESSPRMAMPSIDKSETQSLETSLPDSPTLGSPSLGSPGPSIADETDLPPILPGFVLSAGSRSSLVGYGKRKSVKKDRPKSQLSAGSRLSELMG